MSAIAIDTPDFQHGVVSAQILLTQQGGTSTHTNVGIPPNAETIVIQLAQNVVPPGDVQVIGLTTNIIYPIVAAPQQPSGDASTFFVDVTSVMDSQLHIQFANAPGGAWYVYADAGVHIVADVGKLLSNEGAQYVIPTPPSLNALNHPPVELSSSADTFAVSRNLLPAAGAGFRYRLFTAQLSATTAGCESTMSDTVSNEGLVLLGDGGTTVVQFFPSGLVMADNAALLVNIFTAGGVVLAGVTYTHEQI